LSCFDCNERLAILATIKVYNEKKGERIIPFLDRVGESVAHDYRCHVPVDSYLILIMNRLENKYYRSQEVINK